MENRREFLKKAGILAGSFGLLQYLPKSIEAALAINPIEGSTFLDAEHIVMLMQENRSFDHSFGTLRGVRGYNDRRAIKLANGNPVWLQSNAQGHTYAAFRLDIKNSKASWTSDLPHSWENQIGAWNKGRFDKWLEWKTSGRKEFGEIPLTLGYYTREDLPFYYAFADAFTICDHHFCSSLTGTTTNRHFFWTGKCTDDVQSKPLVRNSDVYFNKTAQWRTFPERLQEAGVSWKVYQNEISLQSELNGSNVSLLGNFTDNNLEWFDQYNVRFKKSHLDFYKRRVDELPLEINTIKEQLAVSKDQKSQLTLQQKQEQLISFQQELELYSDDNYDKLTAEQKELHARAFQTNENDPTYHQVEEVEFEGLMIRVPKGDILHQFREDVSKGTLPTVSWLVAPQVFSDHPSAPMYGAWYVSEILNILTKDPEVWKKTIFILNYDENDGYFDHVPPFVAPNLADKESGLVTEDLKDGLNTEYVTREQELASGVADKNATAGPVGLGYRVPLIVASPWSKGGWVNSEVFDITSTLQFMETFIQKKFKKNIKETNISNWRRAVTGDLTSVFRPYQPDEIDQLPEFLDMKSQILSVNLAKDKPMPDGYHSFSNAEVGEIKNGKTHPALTRQEFGTKPSNAICYELYVNETHLADSIQLSFVASKDFFKEKALTGVFTVYDYLENTHFSKSFTVSQGKSLAYNWRKAANAAYDIAVHGPNGFFRAYKSNGVDEPVQVGILKYVKDQLVLAIKNPNKTPISITLYDVYTKKTSIVSIGKRADKNLVININDNGRWYDMILELDGWKRQYAGRIENGRPSISDPLMGNINL